jgi:hypothetical protein
MLQASHHGVRQFELLFSLQVKSSREPSNASRGTSSRPSLQQGCQMVYFETKKFLFGYILQGLDMENFGTFYGRLEYITAMRYILWPFGNLVAVWHIFPRFGILHHDKSGNPGLQSGLFKICLLT